jgi:cytochrome c-type biogenesis protein CcsB
MFSSLENFLSNFSFLILFLSMLIYWIEISNVTFLTSTGTNKNQYFVGSLSSNISSVRNSFGESQVGNELAINEAPLRFSLSKFNNLGLIGVIISNLSIFVLLLLRWKESGHFPLSNLYESLMFLSWTLTSIHLFLEVNLFNWHPILFSSTSKANINLDLAKKNSNVLASQFKILSEAELSSNPAPLKRLNRSWQDLKKSPNKNIFMAKLLGSITTPSALFTNAFATFSLTNDMQEASPLVPALQSNWLMMHVTVMILSYGALICGSLLAIAYLVITGVNVNKNKRINLDKENLLSQQLTVRTEEPFLNSGGFSEKLAYTFDNLSYRILGIGFPLLTIGILSGAVWANEAWGSYWSWDPKETWALLTWLVFAIYLHTRLNKGWQGKKPALIASLGFVSVWVCYLGVNLLGEGLHSYGWLS